MNARTLLCGWALALLTVSLLDFHRALAVSTAVDDIAAANAAYAQKDYARVIGLLMPKLAELDRASFIQLGKSQSEMKNQAAAVRVFSTALSQHPKDIEIKSLLGYALFKSGKDNDGMLTLKEVVDVNPRYMQAYRYLIEIYEMKKNRYELRLIYQDLVDKMGEKSEFISKLCGLTSLEGFHQLALKYCNRGIELNPREADNYVYLGLTNKDLGNSEEASKNLKLAANAHSKSEFAQISYAHFLEEKKNFVEAFKYYQRAVKADKESLAGWVGVGSTGLEIQKLSNSLAAFTTACDLSKTVLPAFRRATNALRLAKNDLWKKKFEIELEKCGR
jgi:tetratricopeptide (TPR) repeat protein